MKRSLALWFVVLAAALALMYCSGGGGGPAPATLVTIAVTPANPSIPLGKTRQLTATGTYSDGSTKDITTSVTWSSSDEAKAIVSAGLVTTVAIGRTTITASSGGVSGFSKVAVSALALPTTGQTTCSDAAGTVINCATTTAQGQDGALQMGEAWPDPRFTVGTGAEVDCVTDNLTGLMWVGAPDSTTRTWADALTYANDLSLCGYDDWRLPNINEMVSLLNAEEEIPAAWLNTQGFSNVQLDYYWLSNTVAYNANGAMMLTMWGGVLQGGQKLNVYYVWPVRAGQGGTIALPKTGQTVSYATGDDGELQNGVAWPSPRFEVGIGAEADCVTDNLTGLMWVKAPDSTKRTWTDALTYANALSLCGYTDWRLPNKNELRSLIDYSHHSPALPAGHLFLNVQVYFYWSSTTNLADMIKAWYVNMWEGGLYDEGDKTVSNCVWPVRVGQ